MMAAATMSSTSTPSPPHPHITITQTHAATQHAQLPKEDEEACNGMEAIGEGGGSHANFKLGIEDSPELINELRFSIAHSRHASGKNSSRRQSGSKSRSSTNLRIHLTDDEDDLG